MADLKQDLGRTEQSKDALLSVVFQALQWGWRNRDVWETEFCCENLDCHFDQFLKYVVDLQDGLEPGTTHQQMKGLVSSLVRNMTDA